MSGVTLHIAGLDALRKGLLELPDRLATNSLQNAVGAGAAIIRDHARGIAPVYHGDVAKGHPPPGTLKRSIIVKKIPELSTYYRKVWFVTVRRGKEYRGQGKGGRLSQDAYYWSWVEFGHYQVARFAGKYTDHQLRGRGRLTGLVVRRNEARRSGTFVPAQPFMRPAYAAKKLYAAEAITDKLKREIERHAEQFKTGQSARSAYG